MPPPNDTITFALDGKDYEIDLSNSNDENLREALHHYADAGCKTSRGGGTHGTGTRTTKSDPDTAKIRAWAKENGHEASKCGRIRQQVRDAYYAAH